jgi:integrase
VTLEGATIPESKSENRTTLNRRRALLLAAAASNRHTLITDLAESGAGDDTIRDIAGHCAKQMLS